ERRGDRDRPHPGPLPQRGPRDDSREDGVGAVARSTGRWGRGGHGGSVLVHRIAPTGRAGAPCASRKAIARDPRARTARTAKVAGASSPVTPSASPRPELARSSITAVAARTGSAVTARA